MSYRKTVILVLGFISILPYKFEIIKKIMKIFKSCNHSLKALSKPRSIVLLELSLALAVPKIFAYTFDIKNPIFLVLP